MLPVEGRRDQIEIREVELVVVQELVQQSQGTLARSYYVNPQVDVFLGECQRLEFEQLFNWFLGDFVAEPSGRNGLQGFEEGKKLELLREVEIHDEQLRPDQGHHSPQNHPFEVPEQAVDSEEFELEHLVVFVELDGEFLIEVVVRLELRQV